MLDGGDLPESDDHRMPRKVDVAYEQIRKLIVTLELEPGAPIDERHLTEHLQLGRTPVREAIQRLIHEGLIVHVPRRGSWVSSLSFSELQEMIEARRMLEVECGRHAAERATRDRLEKLRIFVEETGPAIIAGDGETSVRVDQHLHMEIARSTGNRYFVRMLDQLQHGLLRYWYVSSVQVRNLEVVVDHHLQILDTLRTGNPQAAARIMDDHVSLFQQRLGLMVGGPHHEQTSESLVARYGFR